jgi:DNA-binding response OmpR family regulator
MESSTLHGRSILVVEDEPVIALDLTQAFERVGAQVIMSTTLHDAMVLVEDESLSGAVLDHALKDGDSSPLCERLKERDIPFLIYSGLSKLEGSCAAGEHIAKPQHPDMLVSMLGDLLSIGARPGQ